MSPPSASLVNQWHPPDNPTPTHTSSYPFISPTKYRGALQNKVVLITGAGRGIGRATALAFAAAGARVACVSRTKQELQILAAEIRAKHGNVYGGTLQSAIPIIGDVTDHCFPARAIQETEQRLGPVDILINNAGLSRVSDLEHEADVAQPWKVVETNLLGTMAFVQAAIPGMIARQSGTIINVVSILGRVASPYFSAYAASKAGVEKYTEVIDLELRSKGIKTYAVHPCMCLDTSIAVGCMNEVALEKDPGVKRFMDEFVPANTDKVSLPADTFVALCVEEGAKALSGRFVDATYDLEEQIRLANSK